VERGKPKTETKRRWLFRVDTRQPDLAHLVNNKNGYI
jgi:hypothetical protein